MKARLKVPARTLIYSAAIVVLAVVFVIQELSSTERNTLAVPALPDNVTTVTIEKDGQELVFTRPTPAGGDSNNAGSWLVGDRAYPADQGRVNAILDAVRSLTKVDVLTSTGEARAYGLDEDSRTLVTYSADDTNVLTIAAGERAAAGNSVYARINDGREIVLLPGTTLADLGTNADDYRSKEVVDIVSSDIVSLRASGPGLRPVAATRPQVSGAVTETSVASTDAAGAGGSADNSGDQPAWSVESEASVAPADVDQAVSYLAPLRADGFLSDDPAGEPFATLTVTRTSGEETITFYPKNADGNYPVRASSYAYPFYLSEWRAKRLLFGLDEYFAAFDTEEE